MTLSTVHPEPDIAEQLGQLHGEVIQTRLLVAQLVALITKENVRVELPLRL